MRTGRVFWDRFRDRLAAAVLACDALNTTGGPPGAGAYTKLVIDQPATASEIDAIEQRLGHSLPVGLRDTLVSFARSVNMFWFLRPEVRCPFPTLSHGGCHWSLETLPQMQDHRKQWIRTNFPDPANRYDRVWHTTLSFCDVGNGDVLGIDLDAPGGPVVFVSHNRSAMHGWRLADDFQDFLDRSSRLAFVGHEDWQLEPFLVSADLGLVTDSENARAWRQWFGVSEGS